MSEVIEIPYSIAPLAPPAALRHGGARAWVLYNRLSAATGHDLMKPQSIFFVFIIMALCCCVSAKDVYVAATGNDLAGTGDPNNPWASINKSITSTTDATDVVRIHITGGLFYESLRYSNLPQIGLDIIGGYSEIDGAWEHDPTNQQTEITRLDANTYFFEIQNTPTTCTLILFSNYTNRNSAAAINTSVGSSNMYNCIGYQVSLGATTVEACQVYNGSIFGRDILNNIVILDRTNLHNSGYGISANIAQENHIKGSWIEDGIRANVLINNRIEDCYRALGDRSSIYLEGNEILNCKYVSSTSSVAPIITGKNNIIAGCDYAFVGLGGVTMENSIFTGCGIVFAIPYTIKNCVLWDNGRDRTAPGTSNYSFTTLINTGNFWDPAGPKFEGWGPFGTDNPIYIAPTPTAESPEERLNRLFQATQSGEEDNPFHRVSEGLARYSFRLSETSPLRGMGQGGVDIGAYPSAEAGYSTGTVEQATILVHPGKYSEKGVHIRNGAWVWGAGDRSEVIFAGLDSDRAQFLSSGFFLGEGGTLGNVTIRNHYYGVHSIYSGWSLYDADVYGCNTGVRQLDDDTDSTGGAGKRIEMSGNVITNCAGNCVNVSANVYDLLVDNNWAGLCSAGMIFHVASQGGGVISHNTVKTTEGYGILVQRQADIISNWVEGNEEGIWGGRIVANNVVIYSQSTGVQAARDYVNNTIYGNGGWGIDMPAIPTNHRIESNIVFANNGGSIKGTFVVSDTIRYNLVDNLNFSITGTPIMEGNFAAPPEFVDGEFRLMATSPAIDAGTTATATLALMPATDYDGALRVQDGDANLQPRVDIGAYEFPEPPPSGDFILAR